MKWPVVESVGNCKWLVCSVQLFRVLHCHLSSPISFSSCECKCYGLNFMYMDIDLLSMCCFCGYHPRSFISFCTLSHKFIGNGLQKLRLLPLVCTVCASVGGAGWLLSWTQVPFVFLRSFIFFLIVLLHPVQEAVFALGTQSTHLFSSENVTHNFLFTMMPMACWLKWRGDILNSSCFAMVTIRWHYF